MSSVEVQRLGQSTLAEASQAAREQKGLFHITRNSSALLCLFYPSMPPDWRALLFCLSCVTSCNFLIPHLVLKWIWGQTQKVNKIQSNPIQLKPNNRIKFYQAKIYKNNILLQEKQNTPKPNKYWKLIFHLSLFI